MCFLLLASFAGTSMLLMSWKLENWVTWVDKRALRKHLLYVMGHFEFFTAPKALDLKPFFLKACWIAYITKACLNLNKFFFSEKVIVNAGAVFPSGNVSTKTLYSLEVSEKFYATIERNDSFHEHILRDNSNFTAFLFSCLKMGG